MIRYIGYACINETLKPKTYHSLRLKTFNNKGVDYLREIILYNLDFLLEILSWNVKNDIYFYRIPSDIMPLITHPSIIKKYHWQTDLEVISKLNEIKRFSSNYNLRLSMHPDQFTVLNSLREDVVKKSIDFLKYHADFLLHVGGDDIIIHIGGVYGDKESAINRFISEYNKLSSHIKKYIRIENDDKSYHLIDIIEIHKKTKIPIVIDLHHHNCHNIGKTTKDMLKIVMNSWKTTPKIHLSSGKKEYLNRSHSDYIKNTDIDMMNNILLDYVVDVMIEAKKKDLAALKVKEYIKERSYEKSIKTQNTD